MSAAVSGGLPGRDPLPQRQAVPGSRRHAVPGGGLAVLGLGGRRAGGAGGHLVRPHHRGKLQQRAAGERSDAWHYLGFCSRRRKREPLPVGGWVIDADGCGCVLPPGQTQEERELVGDCVRGVQDAQEELRMRPRRLQSAFLPEGRQVFIDCVHARLPAAVICTTFNASVCSIWLCGKSCLEIH